MGQRAISVIQRDRVLADAAVDPRQGSINRSIIWFWFIFGRFENRAFEDLDRLGMISVVIVSEADLYLERLNSLSIELRARLWRFVHRHGGQ